MTRHRGAGCWQSAFDAQSMHPSVALHCCPAWQVSVPFTPQSALPPPGPSDPPLPPPHATTIPTIPSSPAVIELKVRMPQS